MDLYIRNLKQGVILKNGLSIMIALLVIIVTLFGIIYQDIYDIRLNTITSSEILGQDSVSLIIAIIFLVLIIFERDNFFLRIINLGILTYFLYIYSYYCFSMLSSQFFLIYILIFSLSTFSFIYKLNLVFRINKQLEIKHNYPRKTISIFFILAVIIMLFKEIPYLIETTLIQNKSIILFDAFYILDLAIVFPAMIIIAINNLCGKIISVIFSGIILVKLVTLMPALLLNDIFHYIKNGYFLDISFDIIALIFTAFSLSLLYFYKRGIKIDTI